MRATGVVGADRLPAVAQAPDVLRENPGADVGIGARVEEFLPADAVRRQGGQPTAVDLHVPEVFRAIAIAVACARVEAGLDGRDGFEQRGRDAVALTGLVEARGLRGEGQERKEGDEQGANHGCHGRKPRGWCGGEK